MCLQQGIIQRITVVSNHRSFSIYIKKLTGRCPVTPILLTHDATASLPFTGNWGKFLLHSPFPVKLSLALQSINNIRFQGQQQQLFENIRYIVLPAIWNHLMPVNQSQIKNDSQLLTVAWKLVSSTKLSPTVSCSSSVKNNYTWTWAPFSTSVTEIVQVAQWVFKACKPECVLKI